MTIHVQVYIHVYGTEASEATLPELYGDTAYTYSQSKNQMFSYSLCDEIRVFAVSKLLLALSSHTGLYVFAHIHSMNTYTCTCHVHVYTHTGIIILF